MIHLELLLLLEMNHQRQTGCMLSRVSFPLRRLKTTRLACPKQGSNSFTTKPHTRLASRFTASTPSLSIVSGWADVTASVKWDLTQVQAFAPFSRWRVRPSGVGAHAQDDRQRVEMKDLEFHPGTLCSRWRSGRARPGRSQENRSERGGRGEEKTRGGEVLKTGVRDKADFFCLFPFLFFYLFAWTHVCFPISWRTPSWFT